MLPNLIHPVDVHIEQLDKASTVYDDDFREPVQQAAHAVVKYLKGQVSWGESKQLGTTAAGVEENAAGYVLFRYIDLEKAGVTLKLNDKIVKLGKIATDLYITKIAPCGHYQDQGGATLVKAYFMDRQPSRQDA